MPQQVELFLGHPVSYWIELEKQAKTMNLTSLIEELARLRGFVDLYEDRIKELYLVSELRHAKDQ
jgi:hypothetical protein